MTNTRINPEMIMEDSDESIVVVEDFDSWINAMANDGDETVFETEVDIEVLVEG